MSLIRLSVVCLLLLGILVGCVRVECLGVNWGGVGGHMLPPDVVVQLMKDNGIKKVKLFDADQSTLNALIGSDIEVMVAIPNYMLQDMVNMDQATKFVRQNVTSYTSKKPGVNIKYVAVGNEPFLTSYNGTFVNVTFPALKSIQTALSEAGVGKTIKATIPFNGDVYLSPEGVPSAGMFRPDILTEITNIVKFLNDNSAPFMVNVYPFLSLYYTYPAFPLEYCFFDGTAKPVIDHNIQYTNMFDANYDTCVTALKKLGYGDMNIMIGENGWPSDGNLNANTNLAYRYYSGLLKKLGSNRGTPLRPKSYIELYLFELLDEDSKGLAPGNFERHWGIFTVDGKPKYPIDLSGNGKNVTLVAAKNVKYQDKKWCQLDPNANDLSKINEKFNFACSNSDCTSLGYGCSCNDLDIKGNASYAFNMFYQMNNQVEGSCGFDGLGKVTTQNISTPTCNFPILLSTVEPGKSSGPGGASSGPEEASNGNGNGNVGSSGVLLVSHALIALSLASLFFVFLI